MEADLAAGLLVAEHENTLRQMALEPFNDAAQARKRYLCGTCAQARSDRDTLCGCTFRDRFFDR